MRLPRLRLRIWYLMSIVAIAALILGCAALLRQRQLHERMEAQRELYRGMEALHLTSGRTCEHYAEEEQKEITHLQSRLEQLQRKAQELKSHGVVDWNTFKTMRILRTSISRAELSCGYWRELAAYHDWWTRAYGRVHCRPWEPPPEGPPEPTRGGMAHSELEEGDVNREREL